MNVTRLVHRWPGFFWREYFFYGRRIIVIRRECYTESRRLSRDEAARLLEWLRAQSREGGAR